MSDLINRQDVINEITEVKERILDMPIFKQWIPCSERLPDYHDEVLVTSLGEVAIAWLYLDGNWRSNDMPEPMYKYIVAWMPLPDPYKGETE